MAVLIITGGSIQRDFAFELLGKERFRHIIVVDGALALWDQLVTENPALTFDHLVGDFDTIDHGILERYIHREDIMVHRFIPEKDNTDTDIAIKLAMKLAADHQAIEGAGDEIWILGATGSRADHMLANIQLLDQMADAGYHGVILDVHNRIRLVEGEFKICKDQQFGSFVSLIPITGMLEGVTLEGFKYPLADHDVRRGDSLCVSNELIEEIGSICIRKGRAYLIESRD